MSGVHCRALDERGNPAETDGWLCFHCLESAERDVRALVLDYRDLEQHLVPSLGQRGSGLPTGRGGLPPLPIAEHVLDLQMDIFWLVDAWDAVVRDIDRLSDKPTRTRAGWAVQQSVSILAPRLDRLAGATGTMWDYPGTAEPCPRVSSRAVLNSPTVLTVLCSEDGVEPCGECGGTGRIAATSEVPGWQGVLDLARLHHRARGALGLSTDRGELIVGVACPRCDIRSKLVRDGEGGVSCRSCKSRLEPVEYAAWVAEDAARSGEAA